ncbi:MAG TPA: potassium channel protein [Vicinamibacterales bacterium]|nr:potassium channel protein [Vicinamibacterales bacterium]
MRPRLQTPVIMLGIVLAIGTLGYVLIEGWHAWDAFYMTVTTVATVGYREVHPLSVAGQAFTLALVLVGVSTALYTFSAFATVVVEGGWSGYYERWRYTRMINSLSDHYVICGYGRIGSIVATEFKRQKTPFVIVDRSPERVRDATGHGHLALEGDASREETLQRLGIARARGLVAAVGTDAENVYAVLTARVMKADLFIIARAEGEDSLQKLKKAGADRVISPYRIGAVQIAQTALRPAVVDFVEIATSSDNLELSIEEIRVDDRSPLAGKPLSAAIPRDRLNVVVVGIQHAQGRMEFNPPPDTLLNPGDHVIVLGSSAMLKELERTSK